MNFLLSFFTLSLTIVLHELGHYLAFVSFRIPVKKISLGFGPTLFRWRKFRLKTLPLGGYVEPNEDAALKAWPMFFVYLAGPGINLLVAYITALTVISKLDPITFIKFVFGLWFQVVGIVFNVKVFAAVSSPVGIVQEMSSMNSTDGWASTFLGLNLALALFNLMPIPGLDGGGAIERFIEGLFDFKLEGRVKAIVSLASYGFLASLFIAGFANDIGKLFGR
jgi:regulator of sigma E protease